MGKASIAVLRSCFAAIGHLLFATLGIAALANVLLFSLFKLLHALGTSVTIEELHWTLTGIHGFPIQALLGLLAGFVLVKYLRGEIMIWVWLFPFLLLCIAAVIKLNSYPSLWMHFFGNGCNVRDRCYDQVGLTMPAIASATYSLGAKLRLLLTKIAIHAESD
ncbi:MAG: hypothetical protein WBD67_06780 [Terracidiphilus sp.]